MEKRDVLKIGVLAGVFVFSVGMITYIKRNEGYQPIEYQPVSGPEGVFEPGEHIVAVSIKDPTEEKRVYEGHTGYKPVGICSSKYGEILGIYYGGYIFYENTVEVTVTPTGTDKEGNYLYSDFGTPVTVEYKLGNNEYAEYEHIISIPYEMENGQIKVEYKDGYEVVGVSTTSCGRTVGNNTGGCILYTNTEPVKCYDEKNFGTPIEKEKVLEK